MRTMNIHMAETVCQAIQSKRNPQMIFSDSNAAGFRLKSVSGGAKKKAAHDLFLNDFVMVADRKIRPEQIMSEWNYKLSFIEEDA